ncbi:unnamed protein product [Cylindrotheca closterium]|uniref:Uncharacterized protein n=1 Tax=Cylindrotheca closterium TaxID=2856 RepID=A0AAD2G1T1_9STRA|nr:unnamed protein product [Cylindrotheca closterium]
MTTSIYTQEQQKILFWAVKFPAVFSIGCSSVCIYHLFLDGRKSLRKVYGRLWFLISLTNIIVAFFCMLAGLATPADTGIYGAFGNETSCKAVGAAFMFIFVVCMGYNAALASYYYISIHTHMTEREFSRRIEPWLHAVPFVYALIGVIVGLTSNMIATNDVFLYCWAAPSPFGCRYDGGGTSCEHGNDYRDVFVFATGLVEMNLITSLKVIATFSLSYTVSKQQKKMQAKYHARSGGNTIAKETNMQAVLFFMACVVPYVLMIFLRVIDLYFWREDHVKTARFFRFSLVAQVLLPMQGAVNMICYFRPKIKERQRKLRLACNNETIFQSSLGLMRIGSFKSSKNSMRPSNPYAAPGGTYGGSSASHTLADSARSDVEKAVKDAVCEGFSSELDLTSRRESNVDDSHIFDNQDSIENLDDIAYLDVSQLEKACAKDCTFILGEDMVGDTRKSIMGARQSKLDMKGLSLELLEMEQEEDDSSIPDKKADIGEARSSDTIENRTIPEEDDQMEVCSTT